MTQKIFQLEGRLSSGVAPESSADSKLHSQSMYGSLYYLNREHHTWTCERFHSVLEANIVVLDKVGTYHGFIAKIMRFNADQVGCCRYSSHCADYTNP